MSIPSNEKTAEHLMHLIVTRNGEVPNFSLLLGSGASSTSGVKTAKTMIEEWRKLLFNRSAGDSSYQDWLVNQVWFNDEDEYSLLFEMIFDQPSQRRGYIEECVRDAHPSWGYVYLTNLLSHRFVDVVFTTNFDDLINEACYLYSDGLRPIVAAHDSTIQGIRVTSGRPKIIKLHGDFLYDNIKNTLAELETLETNTKRKLNQFAHEYGLIVLGYSGRDRSVMDTLELLLRDDDNFKHGVYWCVRPGTPRSGRLESLLRKERVYVVEVDGFDQFTADLHKTAGLALPKPIARPLDMARDRARLFVEVGDSLRSHPVIGSHVSEVLESIDTHEPEVPLSVKAALLSSRGNINEAIGVWEQAYEEEPADLHIAHEYAEALTDAGRNADLANFLPKSRLSFANRTYFLLRAGLDEEVIELASRTLAEPVAVKGYKHDSRAIVRINRAIALKRLGRFDEMMIDLAFLEQNGDTSEASIRAGVAALQGDRIGMFDALREDRRETLSPKELLVFPVFEDYREDPEFFRFVESRVTPEKERRRLHSEDNGESED